MGGQGGMLLMCQNTTMWAYGAQIKRYCVLSNYVQNIYIVAVRVVLSNLTLVRDKPPEGACICETGLLQMINIVLLNMC